MHMIPSLLSFDVAKLQADLKRAQEFDFKAHPQYYHDGNWKVINLVYGGGSMHYNHKGPRGYGEGPPMPTVVLERCPYFAEVLSRLPGKVLMARLSALPPGARINMHYDGNESIDKGLWRIHVPVVTSRKVRFHLGFVRRRWREGEAWVGDFTFPHSVWNRGTQTRVHLFADIEPNAEMLTWLPAGHMTEKAKARREMLRYVHRTHLAWYAYRLAGVDRHGRRDVPGSNMGTLKVAMSKEDELHGLKANRYARDQ
jgi:hypothetical protein